MKAKGRKHIYCSPTCGRAACDEKRGRSVRNHKVASVEFHGFEDVYNLEVEGHHNFPANGIMIHNCMDALRYIYIHCFKIEGKASNALEKSTLWMTNEEIKKKVEEFENDGVGEFFS